MSKRIAFGLLILVALGSWPGTASATVVTFASQAAFAAELTGDFTLMNLDAPPLNGFPSGYRVEDAGPAAAIAGLGIDLVGVNARVLGGQDSQISTPGRDRLIFNGEGFDGEIAINFLDPINGIGAFSNLIDGGRVRAFSAPDLGGTFLGEANFANGGFGGLNSTEPIGSAQFTCDFNADLKCGVYDIQFGTIAPAAVPEPATLVLLLSGAGLMGVGRRSRSSVTRAGSPAPGTARIESGPFAFGPVYDGTKK